MSIITARRFSRGFLFFIYTRRRGKKFWQTSPKKGNRQAMNKNAKRNACITEAAQGLWNGLNHEDKDIFMKGQSYKHERNR